MKLHGFFILMILGFGCMGGDLSGFIVLHDAFDPIEKMSSSVGSFLPDDGWYLTQLYNDDLGASSFRSYPFTTINSAGFYRLADNIVQTSPITISASNVTLDMNGCVISGSSSNGIVVTSGLNNITIKNGTILNATSDGIQVNGGCADIMLDTIIVNSAARGIFMSNVTNGIVRNCDLISSNTGIELNRCHSIILENCVAQTNKYAGFSLVVSTTCTLLDCQAMSTGQGNTDLFGNIYGFVNSTGYGNIFERCIANSTQGLTLTGSSSIIAGFALLGAGTQCHKIIECQAGNGMSSPNGFAVPYGIFLQATLTTLVTQTVVPPGATATADSLNWSPDGNYLASATSVTNGSVQGLGIFFYNRVLNTLALTDFKAAVDRIFSIAWSPSGNYLAAADTGTNLLAIYAFNNVTQKLTLVTSFNHGADVVDISWLDENYIAMSGMLIGGVASRVFKFNSVNNTLTQATSFGAVETESIQWSPVPSSYILATGDDNGVLSVYQFGVTSNIAGLITTIQLGTAGQNINEIRWSTDGKYIAVAQDTTGFHIVRFINNTLIRVTGLSSTVAQSVSWSADNKYIAFGAPTANAMAVYAFDYVTQSLTLAATAADFGGAIRAVGWSPDNGTIAVSGTGNATQQIALYGGIQFPFGNLIMNNSVYYNSGGQFVTGVGISGSSISNIMIGNSSYNNPYNYWFVCNIYNKLFNNSPTKLQNITNGINAPIPTPMDLPTQLQRLQLLAQSLVDKLI